MVVEKIPEKDNVSRWIFAPDMYDDAQDIIDEKSIFKFKRTDKYPDGEPESVVWRKYARGIYEVHNLACRKEKLDNERRIEGSRGQRFYRGAKTANVGKIKNISSKRKHGFVIIHEPSEGTHHAHIAYRRNPHETFNKNDKTQLKETLYKIFSELEHHSCNAPFLFRRLTMAILRFVGL